MNRWTSFFYVPKKSNVPFGFINIGGSLRGLKIKDVVNFFFWIKHFGLKLSLPHHSYKAITFIIQRHLYLRSKLSAIFNILLGQFSKFQRAI